MKQHTDSVFKAVLCCFFSFFFFGLHAQIDLSLQMMADPADPDIYTNTEVSVTVTNTGSATASGIEIEFPRPNQTVYTGGNEWTATQGSFIPFGTETWSVGSLAAGALATLTVSYFMLTEDAVTAYAQVTAANGSDSDSTPGNGTPPSVNEDDEASFAINGGSSFCEIRADSRSFVCNDNGTPNDGSDDTYLIDVFCQIIDGTSCGATFTVMGQTVPYGSQVTVGPFILAGPNFALDVADSNDPSISDFATIPAHSGTCSDIADECAGSILPNGGFELGFNNWNLFSGASTTTLSFSGIRALSVQNDDNGISFSQTINIQAGTSYDVSGYVEEGNGVGAMIYRYLDANGQVISTPTMSATPAGTWDFYESTSTAPANAAQMEVGGTGTPAAPVKYDAYCVRPATAMPCNPDVVAPTIAGCPSNITQSTNGSSANVSWTPPTASDNCTNSPSLTSTHQPGSSFPIGSTTVIYTAMDNAGNSSNCSFTVTVNQQGGGNDIDLELSLTLPNANPDQWTSYPAIATLTNTGGQTATVVKVHFPRPSGVTYTGGNEYTLSQGSFQPFGTQEWSVGSIPAGGSATLEVNYFLLLNDAPTAYAQVSAANENDADSTPDNGTPPTPNEDDEASTDGGGGNNCAITSDISDVQCADNATPNNPNDDTFTFSVLVNSNGDCAPVYSVTTDGNTVPGFNYGLLNTFGPFPISGGPVTMVFTDQMNASVTTSITVTTPPTCSNGGGGGGCAFTTYYTPTNLSPLSIGRELSLLEDAGGYTVFQNTEYESTFSQFTASDTYGLDLNGNVIADSQVPITSDYEVLVETDANDNVTMVFVQSADLPNGTEVPIDINYPNPTDVIVNNRAVKTSNGYAFGIGIVDVSQSPNIINRVIQTDNFGQNVVISEMPESAFYNGFGRLVEGSDGSIFTEWRTSSNYSLFTVPADGSDPWQKRVATDTPSSNWIETEASHDGNFVYTMKTDNQHTFVAKYNVSSGGLVGIDLVDLKTSAVPNGFRQTFASGIEPTADGGLLVNLRASEVIGNTPDFFVLAKYNAAGSLVWKQEIPDPDPDFELTPVGETSDGGALFAGRTINAPTGQTVFIKTTADGQLTPVCGSGGPQPDLFVADLNIENSPIAAGDVLTYNFDASNIGDAIATGNFFIKAYMSTDNTLSNDDIQDGTILTGNYGAGVVIADVQGASTIPASLAEGQYYLILKIDADGDIAESNEGNNVVSATFQVMDNIQLPDLELDGFIDAPDEIVFNQGRFHVTVINVENIGNAATNSNANLEVYISADDQLDVNEDFFFDSEAIGPLAAGDSLTGAPQIDGHIIVEGEFGLDRNHDTYYWIAVVNREQDITESDYTNNVTTKPFTVSVPDFDIEVSINQAPPSQMQTGQTYDVDFSSTNLGTYGPSITDFDFVDVFSSVVLAETPNIGDPFLAHLAPTIPFSIIPYVNYTEITIPANIPDGQYYIIYGVATALTEITKTNNYAVIPVTIGSGGTNECGFFQEYGPYPSANGFNLGFAGANETAAGYEMVIKGRRTFPDDEQRTIRLNTDFDGNQTGFTDITVPSPLILEGVFVEVEQNYDLTVESRDINGQPIWTTTVSLNFNSGTILHVSAGKGSEVSNGYLILGDIVASVNGSNEFYPWSVKMDFNGNEVQQNFFPIQNNVSSFSNPLVSPIGELYFTRFQTNLIELYKLDNNGAYQWGAFVASDLPSTYLRSIRFSNDGSKIYAAVRDNLRAEVNVYETATGNYDELALGMLFSPNSDFSLFENLLDVIPTDDGGFVAGYSFEEPGTPNEGFEWGKIDANNNMEWWHRVPERHNLVTTLAASDGGYVFVGSSENGNMAMMKVTSTGELTPACNNNASCLDTPPVITSANMINDVLVVNWTEVPGAMGYFFESEVPGTNISSGVLINGTEANITTWLPGLTYEFKVKALCATPNVYSPYSNTVSFLTPDTNIPDLVMEGYQVLTANPVAGGDLRVVIEMRNGGGSDALNVQVDVSINDTAIPTFLGSFTGLSAFAGQTGFYEMTFQLPCSLNPGNYTLAITADPQNVIIEGDEGNNTFSGGGLFFPVQPCGSSPCDDITITTGNGSLTINGATFDHVIIKVFDPNWGTAFSCLDTCPDPLTISGLDGGEHYVTIKLLDDNWGEICDLKEFIDVPDPFSGGGGNFLLAPEFRGRPIRLLGIQPNPALYGETTAVILSNVEGLYDLEVYDVFGRKVISQKTPLEKGRNEVRLDISDFRDGTYYVNMPGHNWKYMPVRFVVTRW